MTSLLTSIFGSGRRTSVDSQTSEGAATPSSLPRSSLGHVPSFNDFSLGASDDIESAVESELSMGPEGPGSAPVASEPLHAHSHPARTNVWQSTFSPGMNTNMQKGSFGKSGYDTVDPAKASPSVWAQIAKADALKRISFNTFDTNGDGFIDADELRAQLGGAADVQALIKQADKKGDGKIDYSEFCDLLKDS